MIGGRIVALLAFGAWIWCVAGIARRLGCSRTDAAFGALTLAATMFVFSDVYVGVDDPQILGHALQALGVFVLLRRPRTFWPVLVCAALITAGVFVKHNLVAMPMAAVVWLWLVDRRSAWRLAAAGGALAVLAAALCVKTFGPQFASQVLAPRDYLPAKALSMSAQWLGRTALPLAVCAWVAGARLRGDAGRFVLSYAVAAIACGAFFAGGAGVYLNTMFDADCAVALAVAVALHAAASTPSRTTRWMVVGSSLAAPALALALSASIHWLSPRFWFDPRWSETAAAAREIEFVRGRPGPAMCEDLSICYWAGKPIEADVFNLQQRARREPWRVEMLARRVEAREFSVALVEERAQSLGPRFADALRKNYRVDHTSQWGEVWVPR